MGPSAAQQGQPMEFLQSLQQYRRFAARSVLRDTAAVACFGVGRQERYFSNETPGAYGKALRGIIAVWKLGGTREQSVYLPCCSSRRNNCRVFRRILFLA